MKKLFTIAIGLMIGGLTQVKAQSIFLGPEASIGHSWLNNMKDEEVKIAPALGISALYMMSQNWGLSGALMVSHEGYRMEYTEVQDGRLRGMMTNVNPVYIRFTPKAVYLFGEEGMRIRPKVALGPSVAYKADEVHWINGYKMDAKEIFGDGDNDSRAPELIDNFDFGVDADAGLSIRVMPNAWLNVGAGYYHGLIDVQDVEESENRNIRLNFGLMFGL